MKITKIIARQILDSRDNPTVEADVSLESGTFGRASVPTGASTGTNEAQALPVKQAIENIDRVIASSLIGHDVANQQGIDQTMVELDGTKNKSKLGANAILAVSLACAVASSRARNLPLYKYLNTLMTQQTLLTLPMPLINIINGGKHAENSTDIQEFMIIPARANSFSESIDMASKVFHQLGQILKQKNLPTTVGDEGGFTLPNAKANTQALDLIHQAVEKAGYTFGTDISLGLDIAASSFYKDGKYHLSTEGVTLSTDEVITWLKTLVANYPIISIEDGLAENDWGGWVKLTQDLEDKIQIVGDDLTVTNPKFLQKAISVHACNALIIKPNQIGTLTETLQTIELAKKNNLATIISHRSGETEDTFIADLSVATGAGQIKTGSLSRSERTAKYNQLLRIEQQLGNDAKFAKWPS